MKILVAEDDDASRLILQKAVEKLGHECLVAEDGEKAWKLYRNTPDIDVIISDWMMPGMDGLKLCRNVREQERNNYTYFIFLTALGDRGYQRMGMQTGADDYLTKPLDREELELRLISASRVTGLYRRLAEQNAKLDELNLQLRASATGCGYRRISRS